MKTFKQYIVEFTDKNTHLEHVEDLVFLHGTDGAKLALSILTDLLSTLSGKSPNKVLISVKWDGSPSIVCGINPENEKFFVATKAIFNKVPKLNYTREDIFANHNSKIHGALIECITHLPSLNIKEVFQGDLLFTKNDLKTIEVGGNKFISFCRNTITYAIPVDSSTANEVLSSTIGIAFHTKYSGSSIQTLQATFGVDFSNITSNLVWCPTSVVSTNTLTLSQSTIEHLEDSLGNLKSSVLSTNPAKIDLVLQNVSLKPLIIRYINYCVRLGITTHSVDGLIEFIKTSSLNNLDVLKTDRGRDNKRQKFHELTRAVVDSKPELEKMLSLFSSITENKNRLLNVLNQSTDIRCFFESGDGYVETSGEGYVIKHNSGSVVKLVDRTVFSKENFRQEM